MAKTKTITLISEAEIDSQAMGMKEVLDGQPHMEIKIPKLSADPNRPDPNDLIPVPVTVNGYTYFIKRGEKVAVPQVVSDILDESGYLC